MKQFFINLFNYQGTATRKKYTWCTIVMFLLLFSYPSVAVLLFGFIYVSISDYYLSRLTPFIISSFLVVIYLSVVATLFFSHMALTGRRINDIGYNGKYSLLFSPVIYLLPVCTAFQNLFSNSIIVVAISMLSYIGSIGVLVLIILCFIRNKNRNNSRRS